MAACKTSQIIGNTVTGDKTFIYTFVVYYQPSTLSFLFADLHITTSESHAYWVALQYSEPSICKCHSLAH